MFYRWPIFRINYSCCKFVHLSSSLNTSQIQLMNWWNQLVHFTGCQIATDLASNWSWRETYSVTATFLEECINPVQRIVLIEKHIDRKSSHVFVEWYLWSWKRLACYTMQIAQHSGYTREIVQSLHIRGSINIQWHHRRPGNKEIVDHISVSDDFNFQLLRNCFPFHVAASVFQSRSWFSWGAACRRLILEEQFKYWVFFLFLHLKARVANNIFKHSNF